MKFFCAVAFVCLLQGAFAQITVDGECPTDIVASKSFDNAAAEGRWYIAEQIPWSGTVGITCASALYAYSPSNITLTLEGVIEATKQPVSVPYPASISGPGVFNAVILGSKVEAVAFAADIEKYVVFFSCQNNNKGQSTRYIWIFTRDQVASEETLATARAAITKAGLSTADLVPMNQQNCQ